MGNPEQKQVCTSHETGGSAAVMCPVLQSKATWDILNPAIGTFGGLASTDFYGALVGSFLEGTLPVSLSRTLRFYASNNSVGGIATDFTTLNPSIGEVFFIGDGLTGTGTGTVQAFIVPPTATHLYLGYIDGSNGIPQSYNDNAGELRSLFSCIRLIDTKPSLRIAVKRNVSTIPRRAGPRPGRVDL